MIDITDSVYEGIETTMMYITKDIYFDSYIIAIPSNAFAWTIASNIDYELLLKSHVFGDPKIKERLVQAIKEGITEIEWPPIR
ncbi:hypothetical protein CV093_00095 [Oceanobacillus sp. 143]|uniref:Uncharacterized protein n=1 Tax=Oceanobacillus zhaokaii TaxID=2052660 RepID=A0A345PBX5_9BACI|nr:hypothetical protein CUC15_00095 [Oceanobacillus zhaokaii]QGS67746.1 hypothetical protein CV093_00095 [Oceanobacillus sp. 143]